MKLFFKYIASKRAVIFAWAIFCILFTVSFYAYRLPVSAVLYPAAFKRRDGRRLYFVRLFKNKKGIPFPQQNNGRKHILGRYARIVPWSRDG